MSPRWPERKGTFAGCGSTLRLRTLTQNRFTPNLECARQTMNCLRQISCSNIEGPRHDECRVAWSEESRNCRSQTPAMNGRPASANHGIFAPGQESDLRPGL